MPPQKLLKISFCTTCMNRVEHLQKTLPKNLIDNADYSQVEFVVLDYNSTDGLEDWMMQNLQNWQEKVVYFKTLQPQNYARSHSRNMAFRLASGDILCNLDADNFAGKGFAQYVYEVFDKHSNIYLEARKENLQDIIGKVCFKKSDFEFIQGYDEKIINYGFEDKDLKNRLRKSGLKPIGFSQNKFLKVITHEDIERIKNEHFYKNMKQLFVQKISPYHSKILFVFNDLTFESADIIDNLYAPPTKIHEQIENLDALNRFNILEKSVRKGSFEALPPHFEQINDESQKMAIINFYSQITNKGVWIENLDSKIIKVNQSGYGRGIVYHNFDYSNPIQL